MTEPPMIGLVIALFFGAAQFVLLQILARSLARGKINPLPLLLLPACLLAGLLLCAFFARERLILCAAILVGAFVLGAAIAFCRHADL